MGKKAKIAKVAGAALRGAGKVASYLPGPVGLVGKVAGAVGGMVGGKGRSGKKRSKFSINKYAKRIMKAKLDAKLWKIKMAPLRGL